MTTDPNNQDASDSGEHDMVLPARSKTAPHAAADAEHGRGALERAGVGGPPSTDPAAASAQHARKRQVRLAADVEQQMQAPRRPPAAHRQCGHA